MKYLLLMLGTSAITFIGFLASAGSFYGFCVTTLVVVLYLIMYDLGDDDDYPCG